MKIYNAVLCAGLLMGAFSIRAEDEKPKSWMRQTGEIALKTTDILCDYRMVIPIVGIANLLGYHANMPQLITVLKHASLARLLAGVVTQNSDRVNNATAGVTVATLMKLARGDCWTSAFEDSLRSVVGLGLFVYDPSGKVSQLQS